MRCHYRFASGRVLPKPFIAGLYSMAYYTPGVLELFEALIDPSKTDQPASSWPMVVPDAFLGQPYRCGKGRGSWPSWGRRVWTNRAVESWEAGATKSSAARPARKSARPVDPSARPPTLYSAAAPVLPPPPPSLSLSLSLVPLVSFHAPSLSFRALTASAYSAHLLRSGAVPYAVLRCGGALPYVILASPGNDTMVLNRGDAVYVLASTDWAEAHLTAMAPLR